MIFSYGTNGCINPRRINVLFIELFMIVTSYFNKGNPSCLTYKFLTHFPRIDA